MPGCGGCNRGRRSPWLGQIAVPDPRIFVTLSKAYLMRLFSMTPARFRRSNWLTHRSLDLFVLASSACLLSFLSQPIAAALNQP